DHGSDSDRTPPDTHDDGNQHSGATDYSPTSPADAVPQQGGGRADSGSASRVAQALPPGFTPSQPRQSPPAATSSPAVSSPTQSLPPTVPTGSSTPGSTTSTTTTHTNALPTSGVGGGTQSGTQYQPAQPVPAQSGPAQSGTSSGPGAVSSSGTSPVTALTPVACPAAVANATCYQQLPTPGSSSPSAGGQLTAPSNAQSSASSVPTINPAPPAALPNTGSARVPASSSVPSRSVSSGDCQASGNNTDSTVPAQGWDDFSAWIWGRVQDCINQGMARGGSGWSSGGSSSAGSGSATSTSSKPTKDSPSAKGSTGSKRSKKDDD